MAGFTTRPVIMGTHAVISTGHYLATNAGLRILHQGGNAIDAGVAAGFCLAVLEPQLNGIGGEVPILIYSAKHRKVFAISGQGTAPRRATIEWFKKQGIGLIPGDGFLPATVPAAFDAWVTALREFGTLTLAEVLSPAIELAERGFPMYAHLRNALCSHAENFYQNGFLLPKLLFLTAKFPKLGRSTASHTGLLPSKRLSKQRKKHQTRVETGLSKLLEIFSTKVRLPKR